MLDHRGIAVWAVLIGVVALAAFWWLTMPNRLDATALAVIEAHEPDIENGEAVFWAGGCASCHAAERADGEDRLILAGGQGLPSPYGTFAVPNITMHEADGIGAWTLADFANAMLKGTAPDGSHYYPSFPYASYAKMTGTDAADLWAFLQTLPSVPTPEDAAAEDISFPFNIRRGIGLWKLAFVSDQPVISDDLLDNDPVALRGRYLTEGLGHCAECHTPRNLAGALDTSQWLAGGPNPEGDGQVPNITPHPDGLESWSLDDIAYGLESGFTPDFDPMGGTMASVVKNFANVSAEDRAAIAAYLKTIPAIAGE